MNAVRTEIDCGPKSYLSAGVPAYRFNSKRFTAALSSHLLNSLNCSITSIVRISGPAAVHRP